MILSLTLSCAFRRLQYQHWREPCCDNHFDLLLRDSFVVVLDFAPVTPALHPLYVAVVGAATEGNGNYGGHARGWEGGERMGS